MGRWGSGAGLSRVTAWGEVRAVKEGGDPDDPDDPWAKGRAFMCQPVSTGVDHRQPVSAIRRNLIGPE